MKKNIIFLLMSLFFAVTIFAQVKVSGYYRKDGTYVRPHYRSSPDRNPHNNWSYPGNTNPYTGKVATGNPDTYLKNYYDKSSSSSSSPVKVEGYYRQDGTYVKPHYRSAADGDPYNNWSYPGNTNPSTGKTATGNQETYLNNYYNESSSSNYSNSTSSESGIKYFPEKSSLYNYKVVNTEKLNIRSGSSVKYPVINTVSKGEKLQILGCEGNWCQVTYGTIEGYVNSSYLEDEVSFSNYNQEPRIFQEDAIETTYKSKQEESSRVIITNPEIKNSAKLDNESNQVLTKFSVSHLYSTPSLDGAIITQIPRNSQVVFIRKEGIWCYVEYKTMKGYLFEDALSSIPKKTSVGAVEIPKPVTTPSSSYKDISSNGNKTNTTAANSSNKKLEVDKIMFTKFTTANMYESASLGSKVILQLPKGSKVSVAKKDGVWFQVQVNDLTGFIFEDVLTANSVPQSSSKPQPLTEPSTTSLKVAIVRFNNMVLREGPSLDYKIVIDVPKQSQVKIVSVSGIWTKVSFNGKEGYIYDTSLERIH